MDGRAGAAADAPPELDVGWMRMGARGAALTLLQRRLGGVNEQHHRDGGS